MNPATNLSSPTEVSIPVVVAPGEPARALGVHPAAALFPLMKGPEFGLLVEDIDEHGLREPVVMHQGLVLDGRNRLRACEIAGKEPHFVEWDGVGSPVAFVLSRNLHRRHLNESQRAMIAAQAKAMFEEEAAERKRAGQFGHAPQSPTVGGVSDEKPRETTVTANLQSPARTASADAAELLNVFPRADLGAAKAGALGRQY